MNFQRRPLRSSTVPINKPISPERRRALLIGTVAIAAAVPLRGWGQSDFPSKPVRLIVPFPPGQAADIFARLLAQRLTTIWRQSVVVDNRGGGMGIPAMMAGKLAPPDGYTLVMATSSTLSINPAVKSKLPYDPLKDFAPASNVIVSPLVLVAHPTIAARSVADLVSAAKKDPARLMIAIPGLGTSQHMSAGLFASRAGITLEQVPYKGSGPATLDLIGGRVPLMFDTVAAALPQIRSGRIRAIAVTTAQRIPQLPDIPTIAESGYPGFECMGWAGIVLPAGASRALVERISADVRRLLQDSKFAAEIIARGSIPDPRTPEAYANFIRAEITKWTQVAKEANIRVDE